MIKPVRVLGCHVDITERKRSEDSLRETEERLQAALSSGEMCTFSLVLKTGFIGSENFLPLLGLSPDSFSGSFEDFVAALHPEDRESMAQDYERAFLEHSATDQEFRIIQPDGSIRWFSGKGRFTYDENGNPVLVSGTIVHITERKQAEGWRRAKEAAETANRAKSEFLSRMSHELRTPLNAILGFGQLLEMDDLSPKSCQSVEQILKGGRRLLTLINEVLDICRVESGKFSLSLQPVRVGDALRQPIDLLHPVPPQNQVEMTAPPSCLCDSFVKADRQRLKQVLLNVVSNAIKYNRENGKVEFSCERNDSNGLVVKIADTGVGIADDQQPKLFTPFERLNAEQSGIEGTRLGLAVSDR